MIAFDVETGDIQRLIEELNASSKQVGQSINRALRRTAGTLRVRSSKGLQSELQTRNAAAIRRRLRAIKLRAKGNGSEIGLWFGMNDLPIRSLKGRVSEYGGGAKFRDNEYPGAFVAKGRGGRRTIYRRTGPGRLPIAEVTVPIKDQADIFVEDVIFPEVPEIFIRNFITDLRARTMFGDQSWDRRTRK